MNHSEEQKVQPKDRALSELAHPHGEYFHEGRSVERSKIYSFLIQFLVFNQSHISYQNEGEFSAPRIAIPPGAPIVTGGGATFVMS